MKLKDYPIFEFTSPLKPEHIEFFEDHGFLHFRGFINQDTVELFKKEMRAIETKWAEQNVEKVNGVPIKWGKDIDGRSIVQRFAFSSQHSDVLHEFIQDPRFTSLYPLLGPHAKNPRMGENEKDGLVINHYINIDSSNFSRLGWHTDSLRDVFYGKKIMPMLNVGVHLTDAVPNNGGLKILAGTHKQSIFGLLFRKRYFMDHNADKNEMGLMTKAGDLTIHDGRLWHRVEQSSIIGEASRRQVMYVPVICGEHMIKDENSKTQFYQRFQKMAK
jgi:ectoine hydroxylase-related dioxygenase (phytanoyl-CoA dioxygenase family)